MRNLIALLSVFTLDLLTLQSLIHTMIYSQRAFSYSVNNFMEPEPLNTVKKFFVFIQSLKYSIKTLTKEFFNVCYDFLITLLKVRRVFKYSDKNVF